MVIMAGEHGGIQTDMVMETQFRVLHLDPQGRKREPLAWAFETSMPPHSDVLSLTRSHLLILSNSATP